MMTAADVLRCLPCLLQVTDEDLQAIMVLLDVDRDGAISCADFAAVNTLCTSAHAGSSRAQGTPGVAQLSKGN
jgi:hypothetical protein